MEKGFTNIFITVLLLFSLAFISAQPPFQTNLNLNKGISLEIPVLEFHHINTDFHFHTKLFNVSDGYPLSISDNNVSCIFDLYNTSNGENVFFSPMTIKNDNEMYIIIDGSNFSNVGDYSTVISCKTQNSNNNIGGYFEYGFSVSKTGQELTSPQSIIYLILAFGVLLLFAISFYFLIITPYSNKSNSSGAVIQITRLKYIKLGLILLSWVLFTWFLNILIGLSDSFVNLTMYYGLFSFIFETMNNLALPIGIFVIVLGVWEIFRDMNINKEISKFGAYKNE